MFSFGKGPPRGRVGRPAPAHRRGAVAGAIASSGAVSYKSGRRILSVLVVALVIINAVFFLLGGITVEVVKDLSREDAAPLWTSDLEEPPRGTRCEDWLPEMDAVKDARDYSAKPVVVLADTDKGWKSCPVGCQFVSRVSGACDAELSRGNTMTDRGGQCAYRVLWQADPHARVRAPNDSRVVFMTSSLNSDVPIGQPTWSDYAFLSPQSLKDSPSTIVAILNTHCSASNRLDLIRDFRNHGLAVDTFGQCVGNKTTPQGVASQICRHKFSLLFEDAAQQDHLSHEFWSSLVCGTVPIVVATANVAKFVPADNAFLQISKAEERSTVLQWVQYLLRAEDAYADMVRWKEDMPSDTFLALLDMSVVDSECRLCVHLATQEILAQERQMKRPCRCWEDASNSTLYHLYVRERGRFDFWPFFLRSSELTVASLVRAVYHVFKSRNHQALWKGSRPIHLSDSSLLRAFRIYPVAASQEMAVQGVAAFRTDEKLRRFVEAYPCPKLEVILL